MRSLPVVKRVASAILMLVFSVLVGCAGTADPHLYLLEPEGPLELESPAAAAAPVIGLSLVSLPGYVERGNIVSRIHNGLLARSDEHRWAEDPIQAVSRVLAQRLHVRTRNTVLLEPWPRGFEAELRVDVIFDRLLRDERGGAEAGGQLRLIDPRGDTLIAARSFNLARALKGSSIADFYQALGLLIDDLAAQILATAHRPRQPSDLN